MSGECQSDYCREQMNHQSFSGTTIARRCRLKPLRRQCERLLPLCVSVLFEQTSTANENIKRGPVYKDPRCPTSKKLTPRDQARHNTSTQRRSRRGSPPGVSARPRSGRRARRPDCDPLVDGRRGIERHTMTSCRSLGAARHKFFTGFLRGMLRVHAFGEAILT